MTYIITIVLFIFGLILLFIPSAYLLDYSLRFSLKMKNFSLIHRGESLIEWLDNFGLGSYGHDLGEKLPAQNIYKEFGTHIHKVWSSVQKRGGELAAPLKAIRLSLRQDLKRTRREKNLLHSAGIQVIFMVILVWAFLIAFSYVGEGAIGRGFFLVIGLWQGLGVVAYFTWLHFYKKKALGPLNDLLSSLLDMHFMFYRGALADSYLSFSDNSFSGRDRSLFLRMERTLDGWRKRGRGQLSQVDELFEDFSALAEDKAEIFMGKMKVSVFTWSLIFVLPPLFSASLVGLGNLAI